MPALDEAFGPLLEQRIAASGAESPYPKPFDLPIVLLPPDVEEPDLESHPPAPKPGTLGNNPGPIPLDSKDRTNYLGVKLYLKLFSDNVGSALQHQPSSLAFESRTPLQSKISLHYVIARY